MSQTQITNADHAVFYEGERPLFGITNQRIDNVKFYPGESALKHTSNIVAEKCLFMGKYPFWHADDIKIIDCEFTVYSRAAIWYSKNIEMIDTVIDAPKMFRCVEALRIINCRFSNAAETLWSCNDVTVRDTEFHGADYIFMSGNKIRIENMTLFGNYAFQDAKDVVIRNARLESKDAFWNSENVTVYDSVLNGEYLGWHSKNLRLINCTITGEQPLCYAKDLQMINCTMVNTDLCFEYSTLDADITGSIKSIKNPNGGIIRADKIEEIVQDEHAINPGACKIQIKTDQTV